ncbi:hypothetical protein V8E36_001713 [Tilletia maclaganii]
MLWAPRRPVLPVVSRTTPRPMGSSVARRPAPCGLRVLTCSPASAVLVHSPRTPSTCSPPRAFRLPFCLGSTYGAPPVRRDLRHLRPTVTVQRSRAAVSCADFCFSRSFDAVGRVWLSLGNPYLCLAARVRPAGRRRGFGPGPGPVPAPLARRCGSPTLSTSTPPVRCSCSLSRPCSGTPPPPPPPGGRGPPRILLVARACLRLVDLPLYLVLPSARLSVR